MSPSSADDHAFLWRHGVFFDLSTMGVPNSVADLNNRAAIIATVPNATGDGPIAALVVPDPFR